MSKILRKTALPFGSTASAGQIGVFGSLAATGTGTTSTDPAIIQGLTPWIAGWYSAVVAGNSPAIQDVNGAFFVLSYMICYLMQAGVPEWDSGTTYYTGSIVNSGGLLYVSLTDANLNNAVTVQANWRLYADGGARTVIATTDTATGADGFIRCNTASNAITETLPAVATTSLGKKITIKNVGTANNVTIQANASELIDLYNTLVLYPMDMVTLYNNGTSWDVM